MRFAGDLAADSVPVEPPYHAISAGEDPIRALDRSESVEQISPAEQARLDAPTKEQVRFDWLAGCPMRSSRRSSGGSQSRRERALAAHQKEGI